MVKSILFVLLTLLVVIGVCELIYIVKMLFYFPNTRSKCYCLVVLERDFAIKQLNYFYQKMIWYGDVFAHGIIALVDDINDDELIECNNYVKGKNLVLCTSDCISICEELQRS